MAWLKRLNELIMELEAAHGGPALKSDEQIRSAWHTFTNELV